VDVLVKRLRRSRKPLLALALALVLMVMPLMGSSVRAVDLKRECTVTVKISDEDRDLENANVVVDVYKVADAVDDPGYDSYSFSPAYDYAGLGDFTAVEDWQVLAEQAAEIAMNQDTPVSKDQALNVAITLAEPGMYLLLAHGSDMSGMEAESQEYRYSFQPVLLSLPTKEAGEDGIATTDLPGEWIYDLSISLKMARTLRNGQFYIHKTFDEYEPGAFFGTDTFPVRCVFTMKYENTKEEGLPTEAVITFDDPSETDKYYGPVTVPIGTVVTVTEEYTGASYKLVPEKSDQGVPMTIALGDNTAEFTNIYEPSRKKGEVIINHFYYPDDQRGWQREPDPYHVED